MNLPRILLTTLLLPLTTTLAAEPPDLNPAGTWVETPFAQPVIDRGPANTWEHYAVDNPYVFCDAGKFYCFYEAQDRPFPQGGREQIGLAVSDDGLAWKKGPHNPILTTGPRGAWDDKVAKLPAAVIRHDDTYYLFYSGRDKTTKQIGMAKATSPEGPWTKLADNPVLPSRPDRWDRHISTYPAPVFQHDGKYCLLYRGMQAFYRAQGPGLAVSDDLLHWRRATQCEDRPLIPVSEEIASLAVAQVNGRFVGISQPIDLSKRAYWISDDLIHWRKGPAVRLRTSGVVDTLSNPFLAQGRWTVLYEQGDRIYRAVLIEP